MEEKSTLLSTPVAVLIGAFVISFSILISGGIIKLGKYTPGSEPVATTAPQVTEAITPAPPKITLDQVKTAFSKSQIKFGDTNSKLVIVEIADPSCPFCHAAAGKNPELSKQIGQQFILEADGGTYVAPVPEIEKLVEAGKAAFAYIYYPGHGSGEMGTRAMYCAHEQGKFWQVHNLLMTNTGYELMNNSIKNDKTKSQDLANFLQAVFDPSAMKACLESNKYDDQLKSDMSLAAGLNITGTPGFYVNATPFAGAYNFKDMQSTVNAALGI